MLDALRKGAGTWVAKIFIGLLVLSFAVWGINDIFSGFGRGKLAEIGDAEITSQTFQNELQRQTYLVSNQLGRQISAEETRAFGLPQMVMGQLVNDAALDNQAAELGLGVSQETVANSIFKDPSFLDDAGKFSRQRFDRLLQSNGLSEAGYAYRHGRIMVRGQIGEGVMGAMNTPKVLAKALNRYNNEKRKAGYIVLPAAMAGEIAKPTANEEKAYHTSHARLFTAPEYRSLAIIELQPENVSSKVKIPDEDVKLEYETRQQEYIEKIESRDLDQMQFFSAEKAAKAYAKLSGGADFMAVAKEFGFTEKSIHRAGVTLNTMIDRNIAKAAFALKSGEVSKPVKGALGISIIRVNSITPATFKPFEDVKEEIRDKLAITNATDEVLDLHDAIEDERAGGSTLKEIASKLNLKYFEINSTNIKGQTSSGNPVANLPENEELLRAAFKSDIGVENAPITHGENGYMWMDVIAVTPEKLRPIDSVRAEIGKLWMLEKRAEKLDAIAKTLADRIAQGETLDDIAQSKELKVEQSEPFTRQEGNDIFSTQLVNDLFSIPEGGVKSGRPQSGEDIILARVSGIIPPEAGSGKKDDDKTADALRGDLMHGYVGSLRDHYGVKINTTIFQALTGGGAN